MILPLKRYADFSGRSRRKEFWMFFLFQILIQLALLLILFFVVFIFLIAGFESALDEMILVYVIGGAYILLLLTFFIPNMSLVARRFQDQNISGVVGIVLYVATIFVNPLGLIILVFMCIEGKKGDNLYGQDPKLDENIGEIFR